MELVIILKTNFLMFGSAYRYTDAKNNCSGIETSKK